MDNTPWIPSLPELLRECNARLNWNQVHFAERLGKDPSEVSKILSGKTARPQTETLEHIARVYQQAGLDVTADQLLAARDAGRGGYPNPWSFQDHWLRLLLRVMAEDQEVQDYLYRTWSSQLEGLAPLIKKSKHE